MKKYQYRKGKEVYEVSIDKLKKLVNGCDKLTKKFYKTMEETTNNVLLVIEKNKNQELVSSIRSFEYDINTLTENNKKLVSNYTNQLNINNELENVNSLLSTTLNVKDSIINASGIVTVDTDSINNDTIFKFF